jgi:hypothetical protein
MNVDQLERAKKRATELLKYQQETEELRDFIQQTEENKSLTLRTSHQKEMWSNGEKTFSLMGEEVLQLLKTKMLEREEYIEKLNADDLVNP